MGKYDTVNTASLTDGTLPIVPTPKPKFELFIEILTFALTVFTAYKVLEIEKSVKNLEQRNYHTDKKATLNL